MGVSACLAPCHRASVRFCAITRCHIAQEDARFAELVDNVGVTVRYFNGHVERARAAGGWDWSVEKVLEVIQGARLFSSLAYP